MDEFNAPTTDEIIVKYLHIKHAEFNPDQAQVDFTRLLESGRDARVDANQERKFWKERGHDIQQIYRQVGQQFAQEFGLPPLDYQPGAVRVAKTVGRTRETFIGNSGLIVVNLDDIQKSGGLGEKYLAHGIGHLYQAKDGQRIGLKQKTGEGFVFHEAVTELESQKSLAIVDPNNHQPEPVTRSDEIDKFRELCSQLTQRGVASSIDQAQQVAVRASWGDDQQWQRWQQLIMEAYPQDSNEIFRLSGIDPLVATDPSGTKWDNQLHELSFAINHGE